MKNIKRFSGDAFTFHKNLVNVSLNEGLAKDNLLANEYILKAKFKEYKQKFDNNNLFNISSYGFIGEDKTNLLHLYSSQRKSLIDLKKELTTNEFNERINDCPNCTIEKVASLDHYIPKGKFPDFSVNPINLVPCCSTCNSKKKEKWRGDKNLLFINLYSDVIPEKQYLFVDIVSKTEFKFELKNINNIDLDLFKVIESHYSRLDLLQRFRENSDKVISELGILISSFKDLINDDRGLPKAIKNHYSKFELKDGVNNWKIVLIKAMINSNVYFKKN
jgi:hypothetical protein